MIPASLEKVIDRLQERVERLDVDVTRITQAQMDCANLQKDRYKDVKDAQTSQIKELRGWFLGIALALLVAILKLFIEW